MATSHLLMSLSLLTLIAQASFGKASTVSHVTSGLPGTWTYAACYVDNANGRVLGNEYDNSGTTVESCIAHCSASNLTVAAIEYSVQCCKSCPVHSASSL